MAVLVTVPARARIDGQGLLRVTSRWKTDASRCVWSVVADPDDPRRKMFIPRRVNFCEEFPGLEFRLSGGRVAWNASSKIDPLDPLDYWKSLEKCLNCIMQEGCVAATDVFKQGSQCGFNPKQLRSGARRLGIESHKAPGFGSDGCWQWYTAVQRQELLDGLQADAGTVGWAVPTTPGVTAPVATENVGEHNRPDGVGQDTLDASDVMAPVGTGNPGEHSPPYGNDAAGAESSPSMPTTPQAKNVESLEDYGEIWDQPGKMPGRILAAISLPSP